MKNFFQFQKNQSAVSEILGYVFVFGMIVALIGVVAFYGYPLMDEEKAAVRSDSIYNQFEKIDEEIQTMIEQGELSSQTLNLVANEGTLSITERDERFVLFYSIDPLLGFDVNNFTDHGFDFKLTDDSIDVPPVSIPGGPYYINVDEALNFDAIHSHDPDGGSITNYTWSFEDGTTAYGQTTTHSFQQPQIHTVTLTVTDDEGMQATNTTQIIVTDPTLEGGCGIDLVLIMDSSGSVGDNMDMMKQAMKDFVDALIPSTGTRIAVIDFDSSVTRSQALTSSLTDIYYVIDRCSASGSTNWDAALQQAWDFLNDTSRNRAGYQDYIIFSSDGLPNRYVGSSSTNYPAAFQHANDTATAIKTDNLLDNVVIKSLGIRPDYSDNIIIHDSLISLTTRGEEDYISSSFEEIATNLATLLGDLCSQEMIIKKYANGQPISGWQYSISITNVSKITAYGLEGKVEGTNTVNLSTDEHGSIHLQVKLCHDCGTNADVTVTETARPDFSAPTINAYGCQGNLVASTTGFQTIDGFYLTPLCGAYINSQSTTSKTSFNFSVTQITDTNQTDHVTFEIAPVGSTYIEFPNITIENSLEVDIKSGGQLKGKIYVLDVGSLRYDLLSGTTNKVVIMENGGIHKGNNSILLDTPNIYADNDLFSIRAIQLQPKGPTSGTVSPDSKGIYQLHITQEEPFLLQTQQYIPRYIKLRLYGDYTFPWEYYFKNMLGFEQTNDGLLRYERLTGERLFSMIYSQVSVEMRLT